MLMTKVYKNKLKDKRLDTLLVEMKLVSSRQKAISLIMRGNVYVGEEKIETRENNKIKPKNFIKKMIKNGFQGEVIN